MDKIPLSQVAEWLSNPVTKAYFQGLSLEAESIIADMASGGCYVPGVSVDVKYSNFQGILYAIERLSDAKSLMVFHDLVEEPKHEQAH